MIQASDAYKNAMFGDAATTYVRLQLLDSSENVLKNIDTYAIDGSIDVDKDRASRRKFTAKLDNSDGSLTWSAGGTIWINKKVKLFIGFMTYPLVNDVESPTWSQSGGVSIASDGTITDTSASGWNNAGTFSEQALTGDGYAECTASETTTNRMFGLSNTYGQGQYGQINYAIYQEANAVLAIYENANLVANVGSYATGDVLKVSIESGTVKYYKNGSLIYTSTQQPTYPQRATTAFYDNGATIKGAKIFTGKQIAQPTIEYAPQGVFMLSAPTASSKADGTREATLQGDDKWHQFDGKPLGTFQNPVTVTSGTNVASAIQTLAQQFGETKFNFDSCTVTVPYTLTYQPGEAVGKAITELANLAVWTCFYDVNGYLRFRPINQNLTSSPSVQTYDKNDAFTIYAGADKTFDESKLFNKVLVLGGSSTTALVSATSTNSDANSPISTVNIGTRLFVYNNGSPDPLITTTALAQSRADYELQQRNRIVETQKFSALPNFLHEAEDIVTIYDDWTSTNGNYQLTKFTIPLQPGQLMTGDVWRVTGVGS